MNYKNRFQKIKNYKPTMIDVLNDVILFSEK